ncbi:hypothetical protein, partial, partial [Parasitella parasitica]
FSLTQENASLRQQIADLTALSSAAKRTPNTAATNQQSQPSKAPASGTQTSGSTWTEVVQKKNKPKKIKDPADVTEKHRAAITRRFNLQEDGPKGYINVYIHRSRRFTRTEVRHNLHLIGAEATRIVDIIFPARNVIGILVHVQYKEALLFLLVGRSKIAAIDKFHSVNSNHVADPKYHDCLVFECETILHLNCILNAAPSLWTTLPSLSSTPLFSLPCDLLNDRILCQ